MKNEKLYPTYVSKCNSKLWNQVILLMISIGEGWHYLAEKKLSALLRGVTKIMVIFIGWVVFIRLEQKTNLTLIKKYVKIKIFVML